MATQWPLLTARLVALLPTLSGWSAVQVFDGPPVTSEIPTSYCTVGYVDDDNVAEALGILDFGLSTLSRKHAGGRDIIFRRSELQQDIKRFRGEG